MPQAVSIANPTRWSSRLTVNAGESAAVLDFLWLVYNFFCFVAVSSTIISTVQGLTCYVIEHARERVHVTSIALSTVDP